MELKAEAKPGSTGAEEGTPAAAAATAAACRGATVATEDAAPGSPIREDSTGLPAAGLPEPPKPGKAALGPGDRPGGNMLWEVVRPRPYGDWEGVTVWGRPAYTDEVEAEAAEEAPEETEVGGAPGNGEADDSEGKAPRPGKECGPGLAAAWGPRADDRPCSPAMAAGLGSEAWGEAAEGPRPRERASAAVLGTTSELREGVPERDGPLKAEGTGLLLPLPCRDRACSP